MTEKITMDTIIKRLQGITGFKADATQTDAIRIELEAYAASLAKSYEGAPRELIDAHLHSLTALATHLADTGTVRADQPVATKADIDSLTLQVKSLAVAVLTFTEQPSVPDLSPIEDRLTALALQSEALANTVLAAQGRHSGEITTMAGDLADICTDIHSLRSRLDSIQMPDAFIPLRRVLPSDDASFESQMTSAGGNDELPQWEKDLLDEQYGAQEPEPIRDVLAREADEAEAVAEAEEEFARQQKAVDDSLRILAEIREQQARLREPRVKTQAQDKPGCFYNDDGTITCRVCGIPKDPGAYYTDKTAWTGRKSSCKKCEADRVAAKKAAART